MFAVPSSGVSQEWASLRNGHFVLAALETRAGPKAMTESNYLVQSTLGQLLKCSQASVGCTRTRTGWLSRMHPGVYWMAIAHLN